MSDESRIHLMAFEPRCGVESTVYSVGLPAELQDALFDLLGSNKPEACLPTKYLKEDLRSWLDRAVELRPVRRGRRVDDWVISLVPIDLRRLCNIIALWVESCCGPKLKDSPAYKRVTGLLTLSTFESHCACRRLSLFDAQGRPAADCGDLAFPVFSAQVANALVGKELRLQNGFTVTPRRIAQGTDQAYELMSDVRWEDGDPWAFGLRFHVETLPVHRRARLNLDLAVRRFIRAKWQDNPFMPKRVDALVCAGGDTFCTVPYGHRKGPSRHFDWDERARQNYEELGFGKLPEVDDYLEGIAGFARDGSKPLILSPYGTSTLWAKATRVAPGASVIDKAMFFEAIAEALDEFMVPVAPLSSENLTHLKRAREDASEALWSENQTEAEELHGAWVCANRRRLAECTREERVTFQLIGTGADEALLDALRQEIVRFLGEEGASEGLDVRIETLYLDTLLGALDGEEIADQKMRMRTIEGTLGKASGLTGCIVVLPGADKFEGPDRVAVSRLMEGEAGDSGDSSQPAGKRRKGMTDPKEAIRLGLACSGRLSQFIVPDGENVEHRRRVAVLDLMRQLGFVPQYETKRSKLDLAMPVVGLRVCNIRRGKDHVHLPVAVRMDLVDGLVMVDCPLFREGALPYWRAQLELARLSTGRSFESDVKRLGGPAFMRMVDRVVAQAAATETLLLVQAYGAIRWKDWWPGISDKGLDKGLLTYGPSGSEVPLDLWEGKLHVLRVRCGADGEVPDYFTDAACDDGRSAERGYSARKSKQGLFRADGYVLGLTSAPGDRPYKRTRYASKFDDPQQQFSEKTLNEYCLLGCDDMNLTVRLARYAEALRSNMVQLYKSDMSVNLPAPLHLAKKMEEYIWRAQ